MLSMIVAIDKNNALGKDNSLLWHLSDDLKHFKNTTLNNNIVMGRKTFDSIGKALPKRRNIVLTRNLGLKLKNCDLVHDIESVESLAKLNNDKETFIIGGGEIYHLFIDKITKVYLTEVDTKISDLNFADCFLMKMNFSLWHLLSKKEFLKNDRNEYNFNISIWEKQ